MDAPELSIKLPVIRTSRMFRQEYKSGKFRIDFERWDQDLSYIDRIAQFADDLADYSGYLQEHIQDYRRKIQQWKNWTGEKAKSTEAPPSLPTATSHNYMFEHEGKVGRFQLDFDEDPYSNRTPLSRIEQFTEDLEIYNEHIKTVADKYREKIEAWQAWIANPLLQQKFTYHVCYSALGRPEKNPEISTEFAKAAIEIFRGFQRHVIRRAARIKIDNLVITPKRILWAGGAVGGAYGVSVTSFDLTNIFYYGLFDFVGIAISSGIAASGAMARHIPGPIGGFFSHINLAIRSFRNFPAVVGDGMQAQNREVIGKTFEDLMRNQLGRNGEIVHQVNIDGKFATAVGRHLLRNDDVEIAVVEAIQRRIRKSEPDEDEEWSDEIRPGLFDKTLDMAVRECAQTRFHRIWFAAAAGRRKLAPS